MSEVIKDVLYIKHIERTIGRKLDEMDLEAIMYGEPIYFQKRNGELISFIVPLYRIPHDLMNKDLDLAIIEANKEEANFFEYMLGRAERGDD